MTASFDEREHQIVAHVSELFCRRQNSFLHGFGNALIPMASLVQNKRDRGPADPGFLRNVFHRNHIANLRYLILLLIYRIKSFCQILCGKYLFSGIFHADPPK